MPTNYVLIDFENIQPRNLELLKKHNFKVVVFVGANQAKVPLDMAVAMQQFGESAQYIQASGSGKNALDFHIAYYIGEFLAKEPKAHFHIITRDTGFDVLIKHLKSRGFRVQRQSDLAEIPIVRMSVASTMEEMLEAIVKNLAGRGQSRPRKVQTLSNTIGSLFTEQLTDNQLASLMKALEERDYIKVRDGNISYQLPH